MATLELGRAQVLAHRMAVQNLVPQAADAASCDLLGLGLQNTPPGAGLTGLGLRTGQPATDVSDLVTENGPVAVVLAARGAPHLVSRSQLPLLAAALVPLDDREAADVGAVAEAMRDVARQGEISRPALSEALNDRVADSLRGWCDRCQARHVYEDLFRKATMQAGLEVAASAPPPTLFRLANVDLSAAPDREQARTELVRRYVHLTGVATPADVAAWLGHQTGKVKPTWHLVGDALVPCTVAGRRRWALADDVESLSRTAYPARRATLLPPSDPYLLGDRSLVVPERVHQRQLWRPVGSPGAVLVDGGIAGTWRHRTSGGQLQVTLHPFATLDAPTTKDLAGAAERVAALRGAGSATVVIIDVG